MKYVEGFFVVVLLAVKSRTLCMLGKHSTIELHPHHCFLEAGSLCSPDWPGSLDPPDTASQVLRL
jgi:hypothetical protein